MTEKPPKTKRRPPGDKPTDGKQDADWGFDAGDSDPAVEKKLAVVLVVCLLAGFGFVFYQKFRLMRDANTVAKADDAANAEEAPGEPNAEEMANGLASLDESTSQPIESPYYEPPPVEKASQPTPAVESGWTLTQAEVPQTSLAPTGAAGLPPLSEQTSADTFDPFSGADTTPDTETEASPPIQTEPTTSGSSALTWDEPASETPENSPGESAPPVQSEPDPFLPDEPQMTQSEPAMEISPFGVEVPAEPVSQADPSMSFDTVPQQEPEVELQPLPQSPAELSFHPESPPSADQPAPEESFDPFQSNEPNESATEEIAVTPQAEEDPFSYIAPPVREQAMAKQPAQEQPDQKAIVEPPAWPFTETTNRMAAGAPEQPSVDETPESAESPSQSNIQWPQTVAQSATPTKSATPPNPFSFDATTSRPIVETSVVPLPTIGVREIVVTPSDTFWSISEREYGSARYFSALAHFNKDRVEAPEKLRSGIKIKVPPPEVLEDNFPDLFRANTAVRRTISPISASADDETAAPAAGLFLNERDQPRFRVGERDTLSSIAQQSLGRSSRWTEIYELNRDQLKSPSTLKIGMVLKLPPEAGGVAVSPAGGLFR